jgi:hypothetical protein
MTRLPSARVCPAAFHAVRVRVPACNAHFLKCRHPAAWSGDLCEEPVTFRGFSSTSQAATAAVDWLRGRSTGGNSASSDSIRKLYLVETKNLNNAVQRNPRRFPADCMFQLTSAELEALKFQIGTSKGRGGRRTPPYAFTRARRSHSSPAFCTVNGQLT